MKLINMFLYPVYDIPQQYRRRIAFNGGITNLTALGDAIARGGEASPRNRDFVEALTGVVGYDGTSGGFEVPVIDISAKGDQNVQLNYGGETGIYNFIAIFNTTEINSTRSIETRYVVTGYTSQAEPSLLGMLPDDMRMFINDIYGLQIVYQRNIFGEMQPVPGGYRVVENFVLQATLKNTMTGFAGELSVDIASMAKTAESVRKLRMSNDEQIVTTLGSNGGDLFASNQQATPKLMNTQLVDPQNFVSVLTGAYLQASTTKQDEVFGSVNQFFDTAGNNVESQLRQTGVVRNFNNHEFFRAMSNALAAGSNLDAASLNNNASFTLGNLRSCVLNPPQIDTCIMNSISLAKSRAMSIALETTDNWVGRNNISTDGSLTAFEIAMQLGQILTRNTVAAMHFAYDNRGQDIMTEPVLAIQPDSIESMSPDGIPGEIARRLEHDLKMLMLRVSKFGKRRFVCRVIARVGTVVRIEVQMDGDLTFEKYTLASFLTNRLHTGITTDPNYVGRLARGVVDVMETVDGGFNTFTKTSNITNHGNMMANLQAPSSPDIVGFNF